MKTLKDLAADAQKLAESLSENEPAQCSRMKEGEESCLSRENQRALTPAEKDAGWARRPFNAYQEKYLCNSCLAYWFAQRAQQTLNDMVCLEVRFKAEEERKMA